MVVFDNIEEIFQTWRDFSEYSKALVTLATAIGTLVLVLYSLKIIYDVFLDLNLYFFRQLCCHEDFRKTCGQWAVISGSTDGIGLSMARELARRGHSIVVIGRSEEKLSNVKQSLEAEPNVGEVLTVKIDLSDSSAENYERIRRQIDPDNRDIGILINNAGVFGPLFMRFNRYAMEDVKSLVNVNILATLYLTRMIMPGMLERERGLVVNVSSIMGCIVSPYTGCYGPSKSFIDSFSAALQAEYSSHPVKIVNLTPGPVQTKLLTASSKQSAKLVTPSPDEYAKSAINALSSRVGFMAGTWMHAVTLRMCGLFDAFGLLNFTFRTSLKLNAKNFQLSPVARRRRTASQDQAQVASTPEGAQLSAAN